VDVFEAVRAKKEEMRVPGVAVGLLQDGEERHEGFGVTSVDNPLEVTPETRFQIGSIGKTFTGTAVMYLAAEGLLELDRPVREYLPDLELADRDATERVTMRHLLSHTGGWVGDYFDDTGWGDHAVRRAVVVQQLRVRARRPCHRGGHGRAVRDRDQAARLRSAGPGVDHVLAVGGDDGALRGRPPDRARRGSRRAAVAGRAVGSSGGRHHVDDA
jgi:CubicO group peptidase (beta-lactamase class C family)